jgi:hypothetical protein
MGQRNLFAISHSIRDNYCRARQLSIAGLRLSKSTWTQTHFGYLAMSRVLSSVLI